MSKLGYQFCKTCNKETQWRIKNRRGKDISRCLRCEHEK